MLIEFSVANYRSIKDRMTISLVAANDDQLLENTFRTQGPGDISLLKSAGIYGANASGKSNLLDALIFMVSLVRESANKSQGGDPIDVTPFKLDPSTTGEPSEFEIVFMIGEERYVYGFTADNTRVHEEWLTATKRKPRLLFRRSPDNGIEYGDSWKGDKEKIAQLTRPNALFLSVAAQFNHPTAKIIFDWFRDNIFAISGRPSALNFQETTKKMMEEEGFIDKLNEFVQVADVGISKVIFEKKSFYQYDAWAGVSLEGKLRQGEYIRESEPEYIKSDALPNIRTIHTMSDGSETVFDLQDESLGTQRLFALIGTWYDVMKENRILIIDEMETSFHPLITQFLLGMVHQSESAQLIFTTHDATLLDADLFRRDQVWFIEKDKSCASRISSLWDYKVRKEENFRLGYLKGRYGAIPFIGDYEIGK